MAACLIAEANRYNALQGISWLKVDIRNLEIDLREAIANGGLYEAARIRMDIRALQKQSDFAQRKLQAANSDIRKSCPPNRQ